MFLVLLFLTLCLHAVDCPWWQPRTGVVTCEGAATRPRAPAPYQTHPVPVAVAKAAVPAPAAPHLGRPQGPDPRAGWRVSIRPQRTRAPRREAMALGPLWGRGATWAVARVPTRQLGGWRIDTGLSRRGTAAPPPAGCDPRSDHRAPPPLPPRGEERS